MTNANTSKAIIKVIEIVNRINLETDMAAFFSISGHCNVMDVSVTETKELYNNVIFDRTSLCFAGPLNNLELKINGLIGDLEALMIDNSEAIFKMNEKKVNEEKAQLKALLGKYPQV